MIGARKHQSVIVGMVTLTIYSVENSIRRKCESEQNCWKIVRKGRWKGRKEEVWNYLRSLTHFKVSIFNFMCVEGVFLWRLKSYLKAYVRPLSTLTSWISWQLNSFSDWEFLCVYFIQKLLEKLP